MSDWNTYAEQVKNRFDYDSNDWSIHNVNTGAGIYGHDGSLWGKSAGMPEVEKEYDYPLEDENGNVEQVPIHEAVALVAAADGNRNPTKAGIRIGNKKHMLVYKDDENPIINLTAPGGGACVAKTA